MEEPDLKIEEIRSRLGIDRRTCVFELSEGFLKISDKKIARKTEGFLKRFGIKAKIKLLPDEDINPLKFGVCNVGTAPVFKEPSMKSEQTTQIILGETFDVLEIFKEEWVRIRLHFDGYIGWAYRPQVVLMDGEKFSNYIGKRKVQFKANIGFIRSKPDINSTALRDVVVCSPLNVIEEKGKWLMVELPDNTYGWVEKDEVRPFKIKRAGADNIIKTAMRFLGVSYLWGGKTPKGFDCSGFVQTVFRINGIFLPRDSDMQWRAGKYVGKNFEKFKKGDLLFFSSDGDRITHVGIYTGRDMEIIHSSGFVRLNSLDRESELFSERLERTFTGARRVFI